MVQKMTEPTFVAYCSTDSQIINREAFPIGHDVSVTSCEALARHLLRTYWSAENGNLLPMSKVKPLPEIIKILDADDNVLASWSKEDEASR